MCLLLISGLALHQGCAPGPYSSRAPSLHALLEGGRAAGLHLEDPFAITPEIAEDVDAKLGRASVSPTGRMTLISRYIKSPAGLDFQYEADHSLTASEAFREKRGDCLAFANLYVGIARHLRIPVYFIHISEAVDFYERAGLSFVSSHMAVGYTLQGYSVVADLGQQKVEDALAIYDPISDAEAAVLFYNNVAAEKIVSGDPAGAERLLRYLVAAVPSLKESWNNLGAALMRQGRFSEAYALYEEALSRFPGYQPLYTNAVQAARASGRPQTADALEGQGREFLRKDPFFIFNEGIRCFRKGDCGAALDRFREASRLKPDSAVLQAWIAKSCMTAGRTAEGRKAFGRAQDLWPTMPMLEALRSEFAALNSIPRLADPSRARENPASTQPAWWSIPRGTLH